MNIELAGAPQDVQYFGWALEHLPAGGSLVGLLAVPGAMPPEVAADRIRGLYQQYLYGSTSGTAGPYDPYGTPVASPRYVDIVNANFGAITSAPDELYDADRYQPGFIDDLAYQAMLAGFLGGFAGDSWATNWLALLLLRGPLNRQLTIGRFFGVLTQGQVGVVESTLPTKGQAMQWAQTATAGGIIVANNRLPDVIRSYAEFASSPPGQF